MSEHTLTIDLVSCAVDGVAFDTAAAGAGAALEQETGALDVKARIYQPERVRLYSAPRLTSPEGLESVAATLPGSPVNYEHRAISDLDPLQGVIRGAWVEDGGIYADLSLTGSRVLAEMAAGVTARFSVEYSFSRQDVKCGSCGIDWFDMSAPCSHMPGQVVEGEVLYTEVAQAEGVGLAYTTRPAAEGTGIIATASDSGNSVDLLGPALGRLSQRGNEMSDQIEIVEATTAPAVEVAAANDPDLGVRLAAAEAENTILRDRVAAVEAEQQRAEADAREAHSRQAVIDMARAGRVADVRTLIELRSKRPAELSSAAEIEAFCDAVVNCCSGTGITTGQLSAAAVGLDDTQKTRADIERRAVELAADKSIPFSQARRLAYAEEG